ncbi:MAG: bifunctional phosphopantothenoylcysteine decarboxylase/phosphopantothenate--cysteine ligase CoaBC, partial [Gammaproteobacteria bacterium]
TQDNAGQLQARGIALLGPATGAQACGDIGSGRMLEPAELIGSLRKVFQTGTLAARKVIVTAGPTREDIDPVRFISNRSSGRMGYAVARAAAEAGAEVVLVSGPVALEAPDRVNLRRVATAQQMYDAVMGEVDNADIFVAAAAVADYRCRTIAGNKIKKTGPKWNLSLEQTPDILAAVTSLSRRPFTVGFAAETEDLLTHARQKLARKRLNMIAANAVGAGQGFDSEHNQLEVLWEGGQTSLELAPKEKLARQLIRIVAERFHDKNSNQSH